MCVYVYDFSYIYFYFFFQISLDIIGSHGHTFAIRTDAADKTVKGVRRTLPHKASEAISLHFIFVGEKEQLGCLKMDATGIPTMIRLNASLFEIDL